MIWTLLPGRSFSKTASRTLKTFQVLQKRLNAIGLKSNPLGRTSPRLIATWAAASAEHVLPCFELEFPDDGRPRRAIELAKAWAEGKIKVNDSKVGAWESNNAARGKTGAAKLAALSAGQAAAVAHVAAHELGAAAYAIRAMMECGGTEDKIARGIQECMRQRGLIPEEIKDLVIEDELNRTSICWNVFMQTKE